MTFTALKKLVAQGEGLELEFKTKVVYPYKIMKELVAFANAKGGKLLVGVEDDGTIKGLKNASEEEFVLRQHIEKFIVPALLYEVERLALNDNRQVLIFTVAESTSKPVCRLIDTKDRKGQAFYRVKDQSLQTSREMWLILKYEKSNRFSSFSYGKNESILVKYLAQYERITVETFAKVAEISLKEASELLVKLTLCHLIEICPQESGDFFVMKPTE